MVRRATDGVVNKRRPERMTALDGPAVEFPFAPLRHGAVEFDMRKSDNDQGYCDVRLYDGAQEVRRLILYDDRSIDRKSVV